MNNANLTRRWCEPGSGRAYPPGAGIVLVESFAARRWLVDEVHRALDTGGRTESALVRRRMGEALDEERRFVFGERAEWPDWFVLVQSQGRRKWDPFVHIRVQLSLVCERFTEMLEREGLTAGWSTRVVPVYDREWQPVTTHRALVVTGRVSWDHALGLTTTEDAGEEPALAFVDDTTLLVVSPRASAVLAAAKLPGLTLTPTWRE